MEEGLKPNRTATDISRLSILMELYESPKHGYALIEALEDRLGKNISPSLIYPFLKTLEENGLVEAHKESIGSKQRKVYKLTKKGRAFALHVFQRVNEILSQAIEPNLTACANCGCKIYEGGYTTEIDGKKIAFCCIHCAKTYLEERKHIQDHEDQTEEDHLNIRGGK